MKNKIVPFIGLILLAIASHSFSKTKTEPKKDLPQVVADFQCLNCHKSAGSLNAPVLHGAQKAYLVKQLHSFKEGQRKNVFMSSVASKLNESDIDQVTHYFSSFDRCGVDTSAVHQSPGNVKSGEKKAAACTACHTKDNSVGAPFLNGQNSFYLAQQLRDMKYGRRSNPFMEAVVMQLSEEDIWDLSAYFSEKDSCLKQKPKADPMKSISVKLPASLVKRLRESEKRKKMSTDELLRIALIYYLGNE